MNAFVDTGPGAGVSVGTLVVIGVALTVVAACLGKFRVAFVLALPTLLLAGTAEILAWLFGGSTGGDPASPPAREPTTGMTAGDALDGGHWGAFALTALGVLLIVLGTVVWSAWSRRHGADRIYDEYGFDDAVDAPPLPDPTAVRWTRSSLPPPFSDRDDDIYPDLPPQTPRGPDVETGHPDPVDVPYAEDVDPPHFGLAEPIDLWNAPESGFGSPRGSTGRWNGPLFELLSARIDRITGLYTAALVPRPGQPARAGMLTPETRWFVDALTSALDLLAHTGPTDRPERLARAVREVERRWDVVAGTRTGTTETSDAVTESRSPAHGTKVRGPTGHGTTDQDSTARAGPGTPRPPTAPTHRLRLPPRPQLPPRPVGADGTRPRPRRAGEHPGDHPQARPDRGNHHGSAESRDRPDHH